MGKLINKIFAHRRLNDQLNHSIRIANESLWGQIFTSTITDSKWLKNKSFSPGRWAVGYPMLYIMYRILSDVKPTSILEFGLGESTKMTYQYFISRENTELCVIEQDEEWLSFFSKETFDVSRIVKICPIGQSEIEGNKVNIYEGLLPALEDRKFDFIVIDGPWGSPTFSRPQLLDIIEKDMLKDNFVILMDDYNRRGEKDTIAKALQMLTEKKIPHHLSIYSGLKDTAIVCSANYTFLTTL